MNVKGATVGALESIAREVGVKVKAVPAGPSVNFRLSPDGEKYRLKNRSTGRRMNAVCWHGHRDFLRRLFEANPDAVVGSTLAMYKGGEDFRRKYPETEQPGMGVCDCPERS